MISLVADYFLWGIYLLVFLYLTLHAVITMGLAIAAITQKFYGLLRRQDANLQLVLHSRHTIPISVLVTDVQITPRGEEALRATLNTLVEQSYPEMEIIVVAPAKSAAVFSPGILNEFGLEEIAYFFCKDLPIAPINGIYRSNRYSNLTFVVKDNPPSEGLESADAMNTGLSLARYRYVMTMQSGIQLAQGALLDLINPALFDPKQIVAVRGDIGIFEPRTNEDKPTSWPNLPKRFFDLFQTVEQIKAQLSQRLVWNRRQALAWGLPALWLWRRDLLMKLGGFTRGEALDMNLHIQQYAAQERQKDPSISFYGVCAAQTVGWRLPTARIADLIHDRFAGLTNCATTIWKYRHMIFKRRFGAIGLFALPFLLVRTALGIWCEVAIFTIVPFAALYGAILWTDFFLLLTILVGNHLFLNLLAVVQYDRQPLVGSYGGNVRPKEMLKLLLAAGTEPLVLQPLAALSRLLRRHLPRQIDLV